MSEEKIVLGHCWDQGMPHPQGISSRHGGPVPCDMWVPYSDEEIVEIVMELTRENYRLNKELEELR